MRHRRLLASGTASAPDGGVTTAVAALSRVCELSTLSGSQILEFLLYFRGLISSLYSPLADLPLPPPRYIVLFEYTESSLLNSLYEAMTGQPRMYDLQEQYRFLGLLLAISPIPAYLVLGFLKALAIMHDVYVADLFAELLRSADLAAFIAFYYEKYLPQGTDRRLSMTALRTATVKSLYDGTAKVPKPVVDGVQTILSVPICNARQFMVRVGVGDFYELLEKLAVYVACNGPLSTRRQNANIRQQMAQIAVQQQLYDERMITCVLDVFSYKMPATKVNLAAKMDFFLYKMRNTFTSSYEWNRVIIYLRKSCCFSTSERQTKAANRLLELSKNGVEQTVPYNYEAVSAAIQALRLQIDKFNLGVLDEDATFLHWPIVMFNNALVDQQLLLELVEFAKRKKKRTAKKRNTRGSDLCASDSLRSAETDDFNENDTAAEEFHQSSHGAAESKDHQLSIKTYCRALPRYDQPDVSESNEFVLAAGCTSSERETAKSAALTPEELVGEVIYPTLKPYYGKNSEERYLLASQLSIYQQAGPQLSQESTKDGVERADGSDSWEQENSWMQ